MYVNFILLNHTLGVVQFEKKKENNECEEAKIKYYKNMKSIKLKKKTSIVLNKNFMPQ